MAAAAVWRLSELDAPLVRHLLPPAGERFQHLLGALVSGAAGAVATEAAATEAAAALAVDLHYPHEEVRAWPLGAAFSLLRDRAAFKAFASSGASIDSAPLLPLLLHPHAQVKRAAAALIAFACAASPQACAALLGVLED